MGYFKTKNPYLGKFCRAVWSILRPFGIFYGHLVYFTRFGILCQEKSGSPDPNGLQIERIRHHTTHPWFLLTQLSSNVLE
jgi:hypothetical protein